MAKKQKFDLGPVTSDQALSETTVHLDADMEPSAIPYASVPLVFQQTPGEIITETALNADEEAELTKCLLEIQEGMVSYVKVGTALDRIKRGKLYRKTHKTFEDFCNETFNLGRRRAYQLIEASEVVTRLIEASDIPPEQLPINEAHARAMAEVPTEKIREVWDDVVEEAGKTGKKITADQIARTNERLTGKAPKAKGGKSKTPPVDTSDDFSDYQAELTAKTMTNPAPAQTIDPPAEGLPGTGSSAVPSGWVADLTDIDQDEPLVDQPDTNDASQAVGSSDGIDEMAGQSQRPDAEATDSVPVNPFTAGDLHQASLRFVTALAQVEADELFIMVTGKFLIRHQLQGVWQQLRPNVNGEINPDTVDTLTYAEACSLGICQRHDQP